MSKIILVTGANTGIGYELVQMLAEKGHIVYIGARNISAGKKAQEKLVSAGLKTVKFVQIDVTSLPTIQAAVEAIAAAEGKLDVLVNNAGILKAGENQKATSMELATIRDIMETNFYGLIQTSIAFIPLLRKSITGAPVILNISSELGSNAYQTRPNADMNFVAYNTSKAAVNSYTIALSHELRKEGFKVNAITPGFTSTKMTHFAAGGKSVRDGARSLVSWALLDKNGQTGLFIGEDGKEFPW